MAIGSITDVINAKRVDLILDPNTTNERFVTLQEITMPLARPETREEVALGSVYFYGQHDNEFDATFLLTGSNVGFWLDNNKLINNVLVTKTYQIALTAKDGDIAKINVTAQTPDQFIEKLGTGGVKIYQTFRITEDVDGSNVS